MISQITSLKSEMRKSLQNQLNQLKWGTYPATWTDAGPWNLLTYKLNVDVVGIDSTYDYK